MASEGSVSRLIDGLVVNDEQAVYLLWQRYFSQLVRLARSKLAASHRRVADEEDVALSAFDSFCRNAQRRMFPELLDRDGLWRLLVKITARKIAHLVRDQQRLKRGGETATVTESDEDGKNMVLEEILSREPDPEMAAVATEEYQRLLECLEEEMLREVAIWRMEGRTVEEIAEKLHCAPRTVKRKLELIRKLWGAEDQP